MDLWLIGCVALRAAASIGIGHSTAEDPAREGGRAAVSATTASTLGGTTEPRARNTRRQASQNALDVADSSAIAAFSSPVESRHNCLLACVTNWVGAPSNLCKNTSPELWRATFGQLPTNAVFVDKESLPHMPKNNGSPLMAIASFAVQQPADSSLVRGLF
jgi:NADP-dependent 3-hydroxy acid dehydrogenase YdfG